MTQGATHPGRTQLRALQRLIELHHLYYGAVDPDDVIPLAEIAAELQDMLRRTGHLDSAPTGVFDMETRRALRVLVAMENLEQRWSGDGDMIDDRVVRYLRDRYG